MHTYLGAHLHTCVCKGSYYLFTFLMQGRPSDVRCNSFVPTTFRNILSPSQAEISGSGKASIQSG